MHPSTLIALAAATLSGVATAAEFPRTRGGCENADCDNVRAPKVVRGIVSTRDDSCQYSCYVQRLREAAEQRQRASEAAVAAGKDAPGTWAGADGDDAGASPKAPDMNLAGGAIAALLSENPGLLKRAEAGGDAPQVPDGQFDVSVTTIPRRSEGTCKFAIDVLEDAGTAPTSIVCPARGTELLDGITRGMAGQWAARLAAEYDPNCALSATTSYHVEGKPELSMLVFKRDDNEDSRTTVLGQKIEIFYLNCGAVFANRPLSGFSGSATAAQVMMVLDSRGFTPLMAEGFPADVFSTDDKKAEYDASNPPPWFKEAAASVAQ